MYAQVIIDNPASQVDMEFLYETDEQVQVGMRVKVPFGKSNTPTLGIVLGISEEESYDGEIKKIIEVLDDTPIFDDNQIALAKYIKAEAICPISRILNLMMPSTLRLKAVKYLEIINGKNLDANLLEAFKGEQIVLMTPKFKSYKKAIDDAILNGDLRIVRDAVEKKKQKWTKKYTVDVAYFRENAPFVKSQVRLDVLNALLNIEEALTLNEVIAECGCSEYLVKKLCEEGFLKETYELTSRIKPRLLSTKKIKKEEPVYLTKYLDEYQKNDQLLYLINNKTEEIYYLEKIIAQNIIDGKNTLIVVSDILLGYEITTKLSQSINTTICNLNSDISMNELSEYYDNINEGIYQVVVTTPACALWNYPNLACIIMLDEESSNYRNDQSPRYDLRLVLKKKCELLNIKLVYASFAPMLQTYTNAMRGRLLLQQTNSISNNYVDIVNMNDCLRNMESNVLSNRLIEYMNKAFAEDGAVILILNNKGYSTSVTCRSCGLTLTCPKCHIPLQLHKAKNELYCPSCFYKYPQVEHCPKCNSDRLSYDGFGMEKVLEVVQSIFSTKNAKILKDSSYLELESIIDDLNEKRLDIVITSDVFSRSIASSRINLVVIINLDVVLNSPSMDANHNAYSMLMHANNLIDNKTLVIQTYQPKHFVIKNFLINNYDNFYFEELELRKALKVEPFYEVNRILVKGEYKEVFVVANTIKKALINLVKNDIFVIGPSYNYQEHAVQLIVKHKYEQISNIYTNIYKEYQKTNMTIIFDRYSKKIM